MPTLSLFNGIMIKMNKEGGAQHHNLMANWKLLSDEGQFFKIEPLR